MTTYLTLPLGCPFFSRHENGCDKTTSLSLLLFTFCHLNQLGIVVLVQLQIYLRYLPPTIASKKLPPQILHPPRPSPLLASPLPPPQQSFFSSLPTKKNNRQVRCTSAPSFLSDRLDRTGLNWTRPKDCGGCSLQCN